MINRLFIRLFPLVLWLLPGLARAGDTDPRDFLIDIGNEAQYEATPLPVIVGSVINVFLSVVGILLLALLVYGGYLWMTARGDSERVKSAQETIRNAVIGLAIILLAYSISRYVVNALVATSFGVPQAAP